MGKIKSILCLFVLLVVLLVRATGQTPYIFHHLTTRDGLSNSDVGVILKDSHDFLWIATQSGLNRYDGYGFKVYSSQPGVSNTLISNNIWSLQEDGLGNIWAASFSYMVYNRDKDHFITDVPNFLQRFGIHVDRSYKVYVDKKKGFVGFVRSTGILL